MPTSLWERAENLLHLGSVVMKVAIATFPPRWNGYVWDIVSCLPGHGVRWRLAVVGLTQGRIASFMSTGVLLLEISAAFWCQIEQRICRLTAFGSSAESRVCPVRSRLS